MKELYTALLKCQANMPKIEKDAKNPHFKNAYATLPNVLSTVNPILNKEGLLLTSSEITENEFEYMHIKIIHAETGAHIESKIKLINIVDMQKLGSAYTYALRYGILALLGLSPDMDDDGNSVREELCANQIKPQTAPNALHNKLNNLFMLKKSKLSSEAIIKIQTSLDNNQVENMQKSLEWLKTQ